MLSRSLHFRAAVLVAITSLAACSGEALAQPSASPADDPVAALRMTEQMTLLKELTAAHGPGLIPPTTSATILNYHLPGGRLHRRIVISRSKNFSPSVDMLTGQIHVPADGPAPHGGPPVDCTGSATITVLGRELSSRETRLGDLNCDGVLSLADVSPLVLALVDPTGYGQAYPSCSALNGDVSFDSSVNGLDIAPFVDRLLSPVTNDVPVRLRYRLGAAPWQDLMAGQDILVNDSDQAALTQGEEFIISARMAYPGFSQAAIAAEVLSNSETNAMILVNGDNYPQMAALKGVQNPYGSQQSVAQILGSQRMDSNGNIILPSNQAIQLFELGTENTESPAYDMQDLVLLITTNCDLPQEIVLRDSIGGDNTSTNGNRWYTSYYEDFTGITKSDVMVLQGLPSSNVKLISLRGIVSGININFSLQDWNIGVWSSENAILGNSHQGDVTNASFDTPTSGPNVYGQDLVGRTTYEVQFDISAANIVIPAGQSIFIGLQAQAYESSYSGIVGIMESTELGNQEKQYYDQWSGGWCYTDDPNCFSAVHYDGRFALEVIGQQVP